MINIKCLPTGALETNCYLLTDSDTRDCALVDPGWFSPALEDMVNNNNVKTVLLTHGHYDHIGGVEEVIARTNARLAVCKQELRLLGSAELNHSFRLPKPVENLKPDILLSDGDTITVGNMRIKFIHTPGHTAGSGCFIAENILISGDTLFRLSVGRTDLPTGSMTDMTRSLKRLCAVEGDYKVFPGHGPATSLEFEKDNNPYLRFNGYEDIY